MQQYLTTKRLEATELVRREGLSKLWYTWDYCVAKESVIIIRNTSTKQCPYLYVLTSLHLVESALYSLKSKWRLAGLSPLGTLGRNCFQDHSRCWQNSLLAILIGVYLIVVLISRSIMTNDVEHLFMFLLSVCLIW